MPCGCASSRGTPGAKLDIPGVLLVSSGMFCLVYGFSNAATHGWSTPSTWGWLAAGVVLLAAFGWLADPRVAPAAAAPGGA